MLPLGTQPMNVTTSNTTTVMGHKFISSNPNMMETEEDGGTTEKRKVE